MNGPSRARRGAGATLLAFVALHGGCSSVGILDNDTPRWSPAPDATSRIDPVDLLSRSAAELETPEDAMEEMERDARGGGILETLPKSERKRLIREYREREKEAKRAKVAAAEAFLRSQGIASEEKKRSKKERKDKRDRKRGR